MSKKAPLYTRGFFCIYLVVINSGVVHYLTLKIQQLIMFPIGGREFWLEFRIFYPVIIYE
jgi:hypothetical protein